MLSPWVFQEGTSPTSPLQPRAPLAMAQTKGSSFPLLPYGTARVLQGGQEGMAWLPTNGVGAGAPRQGGPSLPSPLFPYPALSFSSGSNT